MNTIRVISRSDIERHLGMADAISAVKEAYVLNAEKEITLFDTVLHEFYAGKADLDIKSGTIDKAGIFGFKLMSWFGGNAQKGLDTLMGTIMLYDRTTGAPTALLDGASITGMRTGAAGAIGSACLARKDSRTLLVVGAGNQAPYQLAAHLLMFDSIRTVHVYDPMSYEAAAAFCGVIKDTLHRHFMAAFEGSQVDRAALGKKYAAEYLPVKNLEDAVDRVDIIVTVTPSRTPMVMRSWLKPGPT